MEKEEKQEKQKKENRSHGISVSGRSKRKVRAGIAAAVLLVCVIAAAAALTRIIDLRHKEEVREAAALKALKQTAAEKAGQEAKEALGLDPSLYVGEPVLASAGGEGIHDSSWTPRESSPWICVVRAKDPEMRIKLARAMTQALDLHQVRYSVDKELRQTLYREAEAVGFDLTKVTAECYTSCTSVTTTAMRAAGFPEDVAPSLAYSDSTSEKTNLRKILCARPDLFDAYTTEDYTADSGRLQAGDILFSRHHTAVVIRAANPVPLTEE